MEDAPPLYDLTESMFGEDVYTHPEWYAFGRGESYYQESIDKVLAARGKPEIWVKIYRAVPREAVQNGRVVLETGDWICLSEGYAKMHAMNNDNPEDDDAVVWTLVQAKDIRNGGGDLIEWGYWGVPVLANA